MPKNDDTITCETHLVIAAERRNDYDPPILKVVKAQKTQPRLKNNETAVKVAITLPRSYFEQRFPYIDINVPEAALIEPQVTVEMPGDGDDRQQ